MRVEKQVTRRGRSASVVLATTGLHQQKIVHPQLVLVHFSNVVTLSYVDTCSSVCGPDSRPTGKRNSLGKGKSVWSPSLPSVAMDSKARTERPILCCVRISTRTRMRGEGCVVSNRRNGQKASRKFSSPLPPPPCLPSQAERTIVQLSAVDVQQRGQAERERARPEEGAARFR